MPPLSDRDRKVLGRMLRQLDRPVTLKLWGPEGEGTARAAELLAPLAALGPTVDVVRQAGTYPLAPASPVVTFHPDGGDAQGLVFVGLPAGYLFAGLVQLLADWAEAAPLVEPAVLGRLDALEGFWTVRVYVAANCPPCPWVMRLAHRLAVARPERIQAVAVDAAWAAPEIDAVPLTVVADGRTATEWGRKEGFWRPDELLALMASRKTP